MKVFIRLLVFDCDGVLFDSKLANVMFYNYILKRVGRHLMKEEEIEFVHMHSVDECLEFLLKDHPEKLELAKKVQKETSYSMFFKYLKEEEGLRDFLRWAKRYFLIALCTNRSSSTYPLLEYFKLKNFFDFIMSAKEVPKNNPEALYRILDHFKVRPKETLYVGDSKVDENLCKACGVPFVAYKNRMLDADYYVENFSELKTLVQTLTFLQEKNRSC